MSQQNQQNRGQQQQGRAQQQQAIQRRITPDEIERTSQAIEATIQECGVAVLKDQPAFLQAVTLARGIRQLREAIPLEFVKEVFMPLQGTPLGFLTDKDRDGGYMPEIVRDCLIEALLRGFRPVGNEFNIISGRFYGAKAGFERIVHEFPGVQDLRIDVGVPALAGDKGALVPMVATWLYQGRRDELRCVQPAEKDGVDTRIPVKVNAGMGADAILGKAARKMYARIYQRLTGCSRDVIDADADEVPPVSLPAPAAPAQDGQRIKMGRKNGSSTGEPAPTGDQPPWESEEREREPGEDG